MCALAMVCATSAAAFEVSFDGEVLRYRGQPLERFLVEVQRRPSNLLIQAFYYRFEDPMPSVRPGPGCHRAASELGKLVVHCPLPPAHSPPRYRFIPADSPVWFTLADTQPFFDFGDFRGVVYGGSGRDRVVGGDRVYGGAGFDELGGTRVFGGRGNDHLFANEGAPETPVLRGGPGNDRWTSRECCTGGRALMSSRTTPSKVRSRPTCWSAVRVKTPYGSQATVAATWCAFAAAASIASAAPGTPTLPTRCSSTAPTTSAPTARTPRCCSRDGRATRTPEPVEPE